MKTFTLCSFKGGTCKTSSAMHIGACLAKLHKKKVLLIDFDGQANLSIGLGLGPDTEDTIAQVLQGKSSIQKVIHTTTINNLSIISANAYLDGIERSPELGNDPYAHERLRRALKHVENDFDFCFIDTPPSLGWLTQSAFFASQYSIICAIPEAFSVIALRRLREFQDSIQEYHQIEVCGVILSFWDGRGAVNDEFIEEINSSFPDKLFQAKIRRDVAVSRAVLKGNVVFETEPKSRASEDFQTLTKEFLKRIDSKSPKIAKKLDKLIKEKTTQKV